ncbi:MAG: hypothetical protein H6621_08380 [Halobacteriovoraceae bacterium]|nr:hypothetical protein [Halobacteriovoraceae bacterium]
MKTLALLAALLFTQWGYSQTSGLREYLVELADQYGEDISTLELFEDNAEFVRMSEVPRNLFEKAENAIASDLKILDVEIPVALYNKNQIVGYAFAFWIDEGLKNVDEENAHIISVYITFQGKIAAIYDNTEEDN